MNYQHLADKIDGRRLFLAVTAATVGVALSTSDAFAHTYCVDNTVDLQKALDRAPIDFPNEVNAVSIVEGTYFTSGMGTPFHYSSTGPHDLSILGGQAAGCHSSAVHPTILDGSGSGKRVLETHSTQGGVYIENLTIQNGSSTDSLGAGISANLNDGENGYVQVSDCIIRNNSASGAFGGFLLSSGNHKGIYFTNNLVIGNTSTVGASAGGFYGDQTAQVDVLNNTVFNNTTTNPPGFGGIQFSAYGPGFFTNNIIWNNTALGISLNTAKITLNNNDYGSIDGSYPPLAGSADNVSVSPHFVDSANEDFHLSEASTLMGMGVPRVSAATDLDGNFFAKMGHIDLGAYQNTIFATDFDSAQ